MIPFARRLAASLALLLAILAGNAFRSLYAQQEQIYYAIYAEVSVARRIRRMATSAVVRRSCMGLATRLDAARFGGVAILDGWAGVERCPRIVRSPKV